MKVLVLAAGYAVRLYPLTKNQPKPLLEVGGKPLLDHLMTKIHELPNVDEIIVVSNHKFYEHFKEWADKTESKIPIRVVNDGSTSKDDKLGAIKDMLFGMKDIDDEVLVIAGDNIIEFSLKEFHDEFKRKDNHIIAAHDAKDVEILRNRHGVVEIDDNNKVISFEEKPYDPKSTLKSICCYMFKPDIKPLISQYLEGNNPDATGFFIEWLIQQQDIHSFTFDDPVYDIGNIESYNMADDIYRNK